MRISDDRYSRERLSLDPALTAEAFREGGGGSELGHLRILRSATANVIPGGLGTDEYMHVDLHTRITVNAAESHSMHSAFVSTTERGSTSAAKAKAPSRRGLVARKVVRTRGP